MKPCAAVCAGQRLYCLETNHTFSYSLLNDTYRDDDTPNLIYRRVGETLSPLLRRLVGIFHHTKVPLSSFQASLSVYMVTYDLSDDDLDRYRQDTGETGLVIRQGGRWFHPSLHRISTTPLDMHYLSVTLALSSRTMRPARTDRISRGADYPDAVDLDLAIKPNPVTLLWEPTAGRSPKAAARLVDMAQHEEVSEQLRQAAVTAALVYAGGQALGQWEDYDHHFIFALRGPKTPILAGVAHIMTLATKGMVHVLLMESDVERTRDALADRIRHSLFAPGVTTHVVDERVDAQWLRQRPPPHIELEEDTRMDVDDGDGGLVMEDDHWEAWRDGVYSQVPDDSPYGRHRAPVDLAEEGRFEDMLDAIQTQMAPGDLGYEQFERIVVETDAELERRRRRRWQLDDGDV